MSKSNYLPSLSIWTEIPILTNFFEKFFEIFFFDSCVSKIIPSPICMKTAFCGGVFEKDSQHLYKIRAIEKTSSTYIHKNDVLATLLREMFTICLQKTYLADYPLT